MNIDDVPWKALNHAYGSSEDVPELIKNLSTSDSELFDETLDELFGNIWHQGTVYEATTYALPFLIDILRKGKTIDNSYLATLVAYIASGQGYYQVHSKVEVINPFTNEKLNQPENLEELLEKERQIVNKIREISIDTIDLLIPYIDHESSEVRRAIAEAFGCFPSESSKLLPILDSWLEHEGDKDVAEYLEESISTYSG